MYLATASSVIYFLGYIVITSYLSANGIYEQPLLGTKYLTTGVLAIIMLLYCYFFVIRKFANRLIQSKQTYNNKGKLFSLYIFLLHATELLFLCYSASCFILMLVGHHEYTIIVASLISVKLMLMPDPKYTLTNRFSHMHNFVYIVVSIWIIIICTVYGIKYKPLFSLASVFFTITLVWVVVANSDTWKANADKLYNIFFIFIYIMSGMIAFGTTVYEYINPQFGGSLPAQVSVILAQDADEKIIQLFKRNEGNLFLVLETETRTILKIGDSEEYIGYYQIDKKLIKGLLFHPTKNSLNQVKSSSGSTGQWQNDFINIVKFNFQ